MTPDGVVWQEEPEDEEIEEMVLPGKGREKNEGLGTGDTKQASESGGGRRRLRLTAGVAEADGEARREGGRRKGGGPPRREAPVAADDLGAGDFGVGCPPAGVLGRGREESHRLVRTICEEKARSRGPQMCCDGGQGAMAS